MKKQKMGFSFRIRINKSTRRSTCVVTDTDAVTEELAKLAVEDFGKGRKG